MNAMDLFSAGSETTATTLAWAVSGLRRHDTCELEMCGCTRYARAGYLLTWLAWYVRYARAGHQIRTFI